jgi:phosphopantothenoylcysteine decarboxylase/phosphopantothenate--cysteine ligase
MAVVCYFYMSMLKGKKILLGITASIAAYKSILLVRLLIKAGAEVKVVMTPASKEFVAPLTLSTLSKNPVLYNISDEDTWANHVMLGRWADVMLIAPCSANTLAKMAKGLCDNLLQAVYLSATCPVAICPAMDEDMWHHPATKRNLEVIQSDGVKVMPAEFGELASGLIGEGRMPEPESIARYLQEQFFRTKELEGKKAVVTAGPTYEAIDPVRFIGNHSSGKMGIAIAEELYLRGAAVELVLGPTENTTTLLGISVTKVKSASDMHTTVLGKLPGTDVIIMSAAVADYAPARPSKEKIKKNEDTLTLNLVKTTDILKTVGAIKKGHQLLVGFALETNEGHEAARDKLKAKNADMIVLNSLLDPGAGFGKDTNKITIFTKDGGELSFPEKSKIAVATDIVDLILTKLK